MRIVVFTGAGVSRESGLKTFRDDDGLWEGHHVLDVCSVQAWANQPQVVLDFYNARRREALAASPNAAHEAIAALEDHHEVTVVTQNVDSLHERAGSTNVIHLHGLLTQARSNASLTDIFDCTQDQSLGETREAGGEKWQVRPHVVFFGEGLYGFEEAMAASKAAQAMIVVGTTLLVSPANRIATKTKARDVWVVDPEPPEPRVLKEWNRTVRYIRKPATEGVPIAVAALNLLAENGLVRE